MTVAVDLTCYYRDPAKMPLLTGAVLPAARRAEADGLRVHVERHWRHGPHLRLRLAGPAADVAAAAGRESAAVTGWLARHPSRSDVDDAALLAAAAAAGRAELVPGPYEPIHPDNTVRVEPADDGALARLLGPAAVPHRHALLRLGLAAVADSAAATGMSAARVGLALTALTTHAAAYPYGLVSGHTTFLSHVEDFLFLSDVDGALRARFDRAWAARADAVTATVERIAAGRRDEVGRAWWDWFQGAWAVCDPAFARGEIPLLPGPEYARRAAGSGDPGTARRWDPAVRTEFSDFHRQLGRFDYTRGVEEVFGPYRFATNVLYQLMVLCDVTPLERYLAAYLLSRAVERVTGTTWRESLAEHLAAVEAAAR